HCTEALRKAKVVGKFVEYFGEGAASLSLTDRATIANMAPEYGATMGFFGVDEETCNYLKATGRSEEHINAFRNYFKAQGLFGIPRKGEVEYSQVLELDLSTVTPSVAGPKRPQDRIELPSLKDKFRELLQRPASDNGYGKSPDDLKRRFTTSIGARGVLHPPVSGGGDQRPETAPVPKIDGVSVINTSTKTEVEMMNNRPTPDLLEAAPPEAFPTATADLGHGDVLIAAITSCTNTSNPSVMLAAGLLAKKAVEKGLSVKPQVKTSLGPGSRVVSDYLSKTGLQPYLDQLGFNVVGYGCTTCIGNSGPLDPKIEEIVTKNDLIAASVLSGNRNFEARVHQSIKANFLMSPPLVVAFALAGRVDINMAEDPIGKGKDGEDVYLKDIWPSSKEIGAVISAATDAATYKRLYSDFTSENPLWNEIPASTGDVYEWDESSTYIQEPPFFENFGMNPGVIADIKGARPLGIFGDSVTTDHISPAGSIKATSPAGKYLIERGVDVSDFNSYGSRRGNDRVMTRGTFANVRIKNLMVPGVEGGVTKHYPSGEQMSIYDAAMKYQSEGTPLVVIAGQEYGTGSSRDWAAKGTRLLGVRAVIAQSFERIHRSNLVGMGVLPLQFKEGVTAQSLKLDGSETFDVTGLDGEVKPQQDVTLVIRRANGAKEEVPVKLRIDTPIEIDYYRHGGILPYVLRQLIAQA
ncbi:MAG TPA: aconitate hydratase AcnA, partial [Blastocatellia bacterium]